MLLVKVQTHLYFPFSFEKYSNSTVDLQLVYKTKNSIQTKKSSAFRWLDVSFNFLPVITL